MNSKLGRVLFQVYINEYIVFSDYFVFSNAPSFSSRDLLYLPSTIPTTQYLTVLTSRNGHIFINNKEASIICIGRQSYSISSIVFSVPSFYEIIVQDANYHLLANHTIRIVFSHFIESIETVCDPTSISLQSYSVEQYPLNTTFFFNFQNEGLFLCNQDDLFMTVQLKDEQRLFTCNPSYQVQSSRNYTFYYSCSIEVPSGQYLSSSLIQ